MRILQRASRSELESFYFHNSRFCLAFPFDRRAKPPSDPADGRQDGTHESVIYDIT
jgi:hypothetical protein